MSVKLRKKSIADGRISLYLDIYTEGRRKYEFLKFHLFKKPRTSFEAEHNRETLKLAESIAGKRQMDIQAGKYNLSPTFKRNINFTEYYAKWVKDYTNKDIRIARYSYEHFLKFLTQEGHKEFISPKDVTEDFCRGFQNYLNGKLNGETPYNYFTKFKKVIKQASRDKVFLDNPTEDIKNTKKDGVKKDILNFNEIQQLANAQCNNSEVRRAFLFCLYTGLRFCDVDKLLWKQIDLESKQMKYTQRKTKGQVNLDLSDTVIKLLGEKQKSTEFVFDLPSHTGCLKSLDKWATTAKIDKNITWHCARHSFAVNLLTSNNDIKTVSSLLGHSGLRHTEKYTRVVSELKHKAIHSLPEISL